MKQTVNIISNKLLTLLLLACYLIVKELIIIIILPLWLLTLIQI